MIKKILILIFTISSIGFSQTIVNSVVAGGVTSTSANFWIRLSGAAEINVEVSGSPDFSQQIKGDAKQVSAQTDFAGIINVSGLIADKKYFYRVLINNQPAETTERYFYTFPQANSGSVFSFAFGSCQQSGSSSTSSGNVYFEIVKHEPKFFLHLGDWGYPDTTDFIPFDNDFFPADYSRVRQSYHNRYSLSYPMDTLFRTAPVDYVYDDHDFMNNNSSALTSSFYVPFRPTILSDDFVLMEVDNPVDARENIIKGYKEYFPGYELENESRGIYHRFICGDAEFFMLDLRAQRSSNLNSIVKNMENGRWEYNPSEGHSILNGEGVPGSGENQLEWFLSSLANSTAEWKFIVSSVPFNIAQWAAIDIGLQLQDSVLNEPQLPAGTTGIFAAMEFSDKWAGFKSSIDTVLNFISNNSIKNVIVLSGDSHTAAIDDGTNSGLPEIMAGNLDITNSQMAALFARLGIDIWNKGGQGISTPDFNDAFGKVSVYGQDSVELALIDEYGEKFASHTILSEGTVNVDEKNVYQFSTKLFQNYPNPFNPVTTIHFSIGSAGRVSLRVYDILGNEIAVLMDEFKSAGEYKIQFDGSSAAGGNGLASGIYFYKLETGNYTRTKKLLLIK